MIIATGAWNLLIAIGAPSRSSARFLLETQFFLYAIGGNRRRTRCSDFVANIATTIATMVGASQAGYNDSTTPPALQQSVEAAHCSRDETVRYYRFGDR